MTSTGRLRGHYFELLGRIHQELWPRTYLEIGMHTGKSLELAGPETAVIGIDPVPSIRTRINHTAQLFFETSDDFFANHDVPALLGGQSVDLAFIDGMHLFEYALRDFRNVERACHRDSVILVHDCFPLDAASQQRTRSSAVWTGDTWKLVPCLRELRPDLEITTVAVNPSGLTIIRNLDPGSNIIADRYDEAVARFGALDFAAIDGNQESALCVVPYEWDIVRAHLPAEPYSTPGSRQAAHKQFPRNWPVVRHQAVRQAKLAARRSIDLVTRRRAPA
jgi:hypothetical protein